MSQYKTNQFKILQQEWYQRLEKQGFKDIEDTKSPREFLKRWDSIYFTSHSSLDQFLARERYFRLASHLLETYKFTSMYEKEVWRYHCEGRSLRWIAHHLKTQGVKTNKDYVNNIIKCLKQLLELIDGDGQD